MSFTPLLPPIAAAFVEARERLFRMPLRERQRIAATMALTNVVTVAQEMLTAFESAPDGDTALDEINVRFGIVLRDAGTLLDTYRNSRDCAGEG